MLSTNKNLLFRIIFFVCLSSTTQFQEKNQLAWNSASSTPSGNLIKYQVNGNSNILCSNEVTLKRYDDFYIINVTSMIIGSFGILCNFLLILVIIIDPLTILHRGAWITILNLSIADFLACGSRFLKLLFFEIIRDDKVDELIIDTLNFLWSFSVGASVMLLTLLTVQTYIIIKYPVKSRLMVTKKRILLSCTIVWVIAIGMGFGDIANIWTTTMDVLYIFIANITVLEIAVVFQVVVKILITVEILSSRHKLLGGKTKNRKQSEVAKTIIILNIILIVTAFPYFLVKQLEYLERLGHLNVVKSKLLLCHFPYYYEPVALLNFISNPLLYSLRWQDYRRSLVSLFKLGCKKQHRDSRELQRMTSFTRSSAKFAERK